MDNRDAPLQVVASRVDADRLVDHILDPDRSTPLVAMSTDTTGRLPIAERTLREVVGDKATVVTVVTGVATRELADRLNRFEVYGGESRIWFPGLHPSHNPLRHPILWTSRTSRAQLDRLVSRWLDTRRPVRLEPGSTILARVVKLNDREVVVAHAGRRLSVPVTLLAATTPRHVADVVQLGQIVEGVVVTGEGGRPQLDLRPCQPEPWASAARQVGPGDSVALRVLDVGLLGAQVELLPGVSVLVQRSLLPFGVEKRGLTVPGIVLSIDPLARRLTVRLRDLPSGELRPVPVAVYPDGPPYLADRALRIGTERARELLHLPRTRHRTATASVGAIAARRSRARPRQVLRLTPDELRAAIEAQWAGFLAADRERFPLGRFTFAPGFVASAVDVVTKPEAFVRWCALIASNRLDQVQTRVHPVREAKAGRPVRRGGATLWRFSLEQEASAARRIHYWVLPEPGGGHAVEFVNVTNHDDDIPFVT